MHNYITVLCFYYSKYQSSRYKATDPQTNGKGVCNNNNNSSIVVYCYNNTLLCALAAVWQHLVLLSLLWIPR